ncbi:hypothetical protein Tco_0458059 [Tanacetum coccineum]
MTNTEDDRRNLKLERKTITDGLYFPPIQTESGRGYNNPSTSLPEITPFIALQLRSSFGLVDIILGTKLDDAILKVLDDTLRLIRENTLVLLDPESLIGNETPWIRKLQTKLKDPREKHDSDDDEDDDDDEGPPRPPFSWINTRADLILNSEITLNNLPDDLIKQDEGMTNDMVDTDQMLTFPSVDHYVV